MAASGAVTKCGRASAKCWRRSVAPPRVGLLGLLRGSAGGAVVASAPPKVAAYASPASCGDTMMLNFTSMRSPSILVSWRSTVKSAAPT